MLFFTLLGRMRRQGALINYFSQRNVPVFNSDRSGRTLPRMNYYHFSYKNTHLDVISSSSRGVSIISRSVFVTKSQFMKLMFKKKIKNAMKQANNNNQKSIRMIGRERSICFVLARQRPPAGSLQLCGQPWLQRMSSADSVIMSAYRRRQHPNTVRQNRRAAVIIVCNEWGRAMTHQWGLRDVF